MARFAVELLLVVNPLDSGVHGIFRKDPDMDCNIPVQLEDVATFLLRSMVFFLCSGH